MRQLAGEVDLDFILSLLLRMIDAKSAREFKRALLCTPRDMNASPDGLVIPKTLLGVAMKAR